MISVSAEPVPAAQAADAEGSAGCRFLQTEFWAAFKAAHGWKPYRFAVRYTAGERSGTAVCSVLVRTFRLGALAYCPMGIDIPVCVPGTAAAGISLDEYLELLVQTAQCLKSLLPARTLCLRFDPPLDFASLEEKNACTALLARMPRIARAPAAVQPPDTVLLDLHLSEQALLQNMKPKWRYNIRLAQKKGVSVRVGTASDIDIFYRLYEITARRDNIAIHDKAYYRDLLCRAEERAGSGETPRVSLYIAEYEHEPVAAIITLFCKREAVYLYGASSNAHRNVMPAYLLQWTAIRDAKAYGSHIYDFYGIPPDSDEHHPMHGLYRFKTGFGGTIIHRPGSIDVPFSFGYTAYTMAERARTFWFKKIKKLFKR